MTPQLDQVGKYMLAAAAVAICPVAVWAAVGNGKLFTLGLVGVLALSIGVYIGLRHPLWLYWVLAAVLGGLPYAYFPGVHVPMYLAFAGGAILAAIIHPSERTKLSRLEQVMLLLILVSGLSMVVTSLSLPGVMLFAKWAIASGMLIALLRLSRENLATFGRIFVCAATANAMSGIVMATVDQEQRILRPLRIFGYGVGAELRENLSLYVYTQEGASIGRTMRLGGTWVLPNSGALALVIAIVICLVLFRGWMRVTFTAIMTVALMLTLSRSAIFSVAVGLLLVLLFHSMRARDRQIAIGVAGLVAAGAFLTPAVRERILSTFADDDVGRSARADAIRDFPSTMSGNWLFGLGWDRPEWRSGQLAQLLNYVSNAPLLTVYRGGIIVGLVFVALMVVGCVMAYRAIRSDSLTYAVYGGMFIGICLVAFQLDKPVVDSPQITLTFSVFLAFLVYVDESIRPSPPAVAADEELLLSTAR